MTDLQIEAHHARNPTFFLQKKKADSCERVCCWRQQNCDATLAAATLQNKEELAALDFSPSLDVWNFHDSLCSKQRFTADVSQKLALFTHRL